MQIHQELQQILHQKTQQIYHQYHHQNRQQVTNCCSTSCQESDNLDVIFVVDNSCGLTLDECQIQQEAIADLVLSIKADGNPRIGYIQFNGIGIGRFLQFQTRIDLSDTTYNSGNGNRELLAAGIASYSCLETQATTNTHAGIESAILSFIDDNDRFQRVVVISNCMNDLNDSCALSQDLKIKIFKFQLLIL